MAVCPKVDVENHYDDVTREDDPCNLNSASVDKLLQPLCHWLDLKCSDLASVEYTHPRSLGELWVGAS